MNGTARASRKVGKVSGKLLELGKFGQRGTELQYEFLKVAERDGDITTLQRVAVPVELNGLLEMGEFIDLFLTRRGLWHFCYGVRVGDKSAESYRGYRFFFIFNRLMMYLNLMFGAYLLMTPGLTWAGAGLLVFGLLFLYLGPASPRRMHALFAASTGRNSEPNRSQTEAIGGGRGDRSGS